MREFNGNKFTVLYKGKLAGDELKLIRTFEGEFPGGQTPPQLDFTVKRAIAVRTTTLAAPREEEG